VTSPSPVHCDAILLNTYQEFSGDLQNYSDRNFIDLTNHKSSPLTYQSPPKKGITELCTLEENRSHTILSFFLFTVQRANQRKYQMLPKKFERVASVADPNATAAAVSAGAAGADATPSQQQPAAVNERTEISSRDDRHPKPKQANPFSVSKRTKSLDNAWYHYDSFHCVLVTIFRASSHSAVPRRRTGRLNSWTFKRVPMAGIREFFVESDNLCDFESRFSKTVSANFVFQVFFSE